MTTTDDTGGGSSAVAEVPDAVAEAALARAEAAETGDDHRILLVDGVGLALLSLQGADPRQQELLVDQHQQRRQRHGERHHHRQQAGDLAREHTVLDGEGEQHEGELAALGEGE